MLEPSHALIVSGVLLIFGFANAFVGRDIFRPLLVAYGFIAGILVVGAVAQYTNTEASALAVIIVGGLFALLSFIIYYLGLAMLGAGASIVIVQYIAQALGLTPAPLLLLAIAVIVGVLAIIFHDYILILMTALGGATMVAQALYLFFPDTQARFSFMNGLTFVNVGTPALVLGAIVTLVLAGLGIYVQYKSFEEHKHLSY